MNKLVNKQTHQNFEQIKQIDEYCNEFWYARALAKILDYTDFRNFTKVIHKAKSACEASGNKASDHFRDVTKMVTIGSGAKRPIDDIMLTRYACYLIAQNGDPAKDEIAFAHTYFALQTRKQELLEERLVLQSRLDARYKLRESETALSENIYEHGVDDKGFGRIRSKGDRALFGGNNTQAMKKQLEVPKNRPLADFLATVTIAAENLSTEITDFNVNEHDLHGEHAITGEHVQNNLSLREMLNNRGIKPEELPAEEDLKKLERRVATASKKLIKESALPQKENGDE